MKKSTTKMIGPLLILLATSAAGWTSPLSAQAVRQVFPDWDVRPQIVVVPSRSFMAATRPYARVPLLERHLVHAHWPEEKDRSPTLEKTQ